MEFLQGRSLYRVWQQRQGEAEIAVGQKCLICVLFNKNHKSPNSVEFQLFWSWWKHMYKQKRLVRWGTSVENKSKWLSMPTPARPHPSHLRWAPGRCLHPTASAQHWPVFRVNSVSPLPFQVCSLKISQKSTVSQSCLVELYECLSSTLSCLFMLLEKKKDKNIVWVEKIKSKEKLSKKKESSAGHSSTRL